MNLLLVSGSVPWFIRENPIEMDDLGCFPRFLETPKYIPIGSILMVYISLQFLPSKNRLPKLSLRQAVKVKSCSPSTKMRCCKNKTPLRFRKVILCLFRVILVFLKPCKLRVIFLFYFEAWFLNFHVSPPFGEFLFDFFPTTKQVNQIKGMFGVFPIWEGSNNAL